MLITDIYKYIDHHYLCHVAVIYMYFVHKLEVELAA